MNEPLSLKPADCAELISRSRSVTALSGAGISTAAGIPDFRGPRGLYVTRRYDPEKVFDIRWFRRDHGYFYEFAHDFVTMMETVRPTFTHFFLARLEAAGTLSGVITQNIDMLHQSAGSRTVVELHGSYGSATCCGCGRAFDALSNAWWVDEMRSSPCPPVVLCPACKGVLKPDVVFFGEAVKGYDEAEHMIAESDLLLVLGSSLTVTPASLLPLGAGGSTVVVNRGAVTLDPSPLRFFVDDEADAYLREVADFLGMRDHAVPAQLLE
jgi:NAD-dependent deacetylase